MRKNATRTYLNKVWAAARAFSPESRFSKANLNTAWRKAPDPLKPRLLRWILHPRSRWQTMGDMEIDKYSQS